MKYKFLILLSLLFIISISVVSAENVDNQTIAEIDDTQDIDSVILSEDNANENTEGTFLEFEQGTIWKSSAGDRIVLDRDYSYDGGDRKVMSIDKELTIIGNGHTFDGKNGARIFYIAAKANKVTFMNVNFINAKIDGAGGAILNDGAELVLLNCKFINNKITGTTGGAISSNNADNVVIDGCTFTGNFATGVGGAVSITGNNAKITNSIFSDNQARDNLGGAIIVLGDGNTIKNNTFTNNKAGRDGGAVDAEGKTAGSKGSGITISDNTFTGNSAAFGGAVGLNAKDSEVSNNIFKSNKAIDSKSYNSAGIGGALRAMGEKNLKIINNTFTDNTAYRQGGAFYAEGTSNIISKNILTNNHATNDAGGSMNVIGNSVTISDNNIDTSSSKNAGGAIFIKGSNAKITGNTIKKATSGAYGGAISINGASATVSNNVLADNTASDNGGAIYVTGSKAVIDNNTITNNKGRSGGAIFADSASAKIINNEFSKNTATTAGAIYGKGTGPEVTKNTFVGAKKSDNIIVWSDNPQFIGNNFTADPDSGKLETIFVASAVTTVYNGNKNLVITLKDENGEVVSGAKISVALTGKTLSGTTGTNGQVKLSTNAVAPANYNAKMTFAGNDKYASATGIVKLTVKKATVKLTAAAKTFKKSIKSKKYSVTLKTNQNKVMKNTKLTLKVNKVTYTAKTNAKGVATFSITKLTKKGTFTANIKYAASKFYNALSKNVKITIK